MTDQNAQKPSNDDDIERLELSLKRNIATSHVTHALLCALIKTHPDPRRLLQAFLPAATVIDDLRLEKARAGVFQQQFDLTYGAYVDLIKQRVASVGDADS